MAGDQWMIKILNQVRNSQKINSPWQRTQWIISCEALLGGTLAIVPETVGCFNHTLYQPPKKRKFEATIYKQVESILRRTKV